MARRKGRPAASADGGHGCSPTDGRNGGGATARRRWARCRRATPDPRGPTPGSGAGAGAGVRLSSPSIGYGLLEVPEVALVDVPFVVTVGLSETFIEGKSDKELRRRRGTPAGIQAAGALRRTSRPSRSCNGRARPSSSTSRATISTPRLRSASRPERGGAARGSPPGNVLDRRSAARHHVAWHRDRGSRGGARTSCKGPDRWRLAAFPGYAGSGSDDPDHRRSESRSWISVVDPHGRSRPWSRAA